MFQAATERALFSAPPRSAPPARHSARAAARPKSTTNSERHWLEDVATIVVLGALAATSLTIAIWLFRGFVESLVFSNGPNLMRGFMGM